MDKIKNKKILIQVFCIIASFVLWLYVANVENPTQTVKLRGVIVRLENTERITDSRLAILPHDEFNVTLTIKGPSSEVNRMKSDQFILAADFGTYSLRKGENSIPVYVKQAPPGNVNVVETYLSIKVDLDDLVEKSVPIKASGLKVTTKAGYTAFEPVFKPVNVIVSGAAQYVNAVSYVDAESTFKDLEKDVVANLPLLARNSTDKTISEVVLTPNLVDVVIPVKKTKTIPVNVKTKGTINKDLVLTKPIEIVPDKIEIAGDVDLLNSINSLDIEPIDLSTLTSSKNVDVKIIVPNNITIVNGKNTVEAKIIIEKIITVTRTLDIRFNNLGADYNMESDINKVSIDIRGIESKINSLNLDDIKVFVDLKNLVEGNAQVATINVTVPEGISVINKTPAGVKVNIIKKIPAVTPTPIPTPTPTPTPSTTQ